MRYPVGRWIQLPPHSLIMAKPLIGGRTAAAPSRSGQRMGSLLTLRACEDMEHPVFSPQPAMNNPLTSLKEAALQAAIRAFINREIAASGVVTELAINTNSKTIRVGLDLRGEPSPIWINVGSYELSETNSAIRIAFYNLNASREWITAALNKYVVGHTFPLPDVARFLL